MKSRRIAALACGLLFTVLVGSGYSVIPPTTPVANTGAPGEQTCAKSGCHVSMVNAGTGSVSLNFPAADYVADSTYLVSITVEDPSQQLFGFQLTVLGIDENTVGTISLVNAATTFRVISNNREYLSHRNPSSSGVWEFEWTAPSADTYNGEVNFYFSGNAVNADTENTGDQVYTGSFTMREGVGAPVGVFDASASADVGLAVYPNPVVNRFRVDTDVVCELVVVDVDGSVVMQIEAYAGGWVDVSELASGMYFVGLEGNWGRIVR